MSKKNDVPELTAEEELSLLKDDLAQALAVIEDLKSEKADEAAAEKEISDEKRAALEAAKKPVKIKALGGEGERPLEPFDVNGFRGELKKDEERTVPAGVAEVLVAAGQARYIN